MNTLEMERLVARVLSHESPVDFGIVAEDVQGYLDQLYEAGDAVEPTITLEVLACAEGRVRGAYWWEGAAELCKVLSRLNSPMAKDGLLTILKTHSRIVEFDGVRAAAANGLASFSDPQLVPELTQCLQLPNAPVLAIKRAIEALGGDASASPQVIVEESRQIGDAREAVEYFARHEHEVPGWPKPFQGAFYYFAAGEVGVIYGLAAALPLFAASLVANPSPNAAAWLSFRDYAPSPENARLLADKYPLPECYLATLPPPPERKRETAPAAPAKATAKRWWQFWK